MKKILLPTDFSDNANQAINYAIDLFGLNKVQYILVHAFVEPRNSADMLVSINDILQKQVKEDLDKAYDRIIEKYPQVTPIIEKRLEYGSLYRALAAIVEEDNIDYIVMGTRGASGLKKAIMGSNTSTILKKVKCPVIVVPETFQLKPIKKIGLATDYSGLDNDMALQPLTTLLKSSGSELLVVNVTKEQVLAGGKHEKKMGDMNLGHMFSGITQSFYTVDDQDVIGAVKHFIKEHKVDILAMIAKEHTLLERLFTPSLTKEMSMASDIPLLIIHM